MKNRSRAKKRAAGENDGPTIKFDSTARRKYLTGFQKRKTERRKKAVKEAIEKENWDKIQLRKEHREEVKKNWRELQRSEALTLKALGDIEDKKMLQDAPVEDDREVGEAPVTVAFAEEDDDPFGDCEVTTTAADWNPVGGGLAANASKLWPALLQSGGSAAGGHLVTWQPEDEDADAAAAASFAKQRRRAVVEKKEWERHEKALNRRVEKRIELKQRFKPKKKGSKKDKKKGGKTSHKTRRKLQKAANKKGGRK